MTRVVPPSRNRKPELFQKAPADQAFTPYDESHMAVYLSVLHARAEGVADPEIARSILGIDPDADPVQALEAVETHHRRALWLTSATGRRHMLAEPGA